MKTHNTKERFVIGTGRCGSTILSKMLDLHSHVAVLSEFLVAMDFVKKYGEREVSGVELADILNCGLGSNGEFKKIGAHLATPEIAFDATAAPLNVVPDNYRDGVLPDLILLPLANLFDDPGKVFDELIEFAQAQPTRLLSQQYGLLFEWVTRRAGKTLWIERSGGTIAHLPELVALFPNAKFLHLHRNPLDVALSMRAHHHLRLFLFKRKRLVTADGVAWDDLDEGDLNNDMPMSPRLQSIFDHELPLELFLRDWNDLILRGFTALKALSPNQYTEISFEDLMANPQEVMRRVAEFFELPDDEAWLAEACALLKPGTAGHQEPSAEQLVMLDDHCEAVRVLLGRKPPVMLSN